MELINPISPVILPNICQLDSHYKKGSHGSYSYQFTPYEKPLEIRRNSEKWLSYEDIADAIDSSDLKILESATFANEICDMRTSRKRFTIEEFGQATRIQRMDC